MAIHWLLKNGAKKEAENGISLFRVMLLDSTFKQLFW